MTTQTKLVYLDTAIWASYIIGQTDRHFPFSSSIIEKMERGEFQVILSKLVIMETIDVIRKRITQYERYTGILDDTKRDEIKRKINEKISKFISATTEWEHDNKILMSDGTLSYEDFIHDSFLYIFSYWGSIREEWKCGSCKADLTPNRYLYKGLGQYDFQHVRIAKVLNASEFFTTDKAFNELNSSGKFTPMVFTTN